MSKAEKFIQDCTRNCGNEILIPLKDNKGYYTESYTPWLTPDQARRAVEIAREEMMEKVCEYLEPEVMIMLAGDKIDTDKFIEDIKKVMKDE